MFLKMRTPLLMITPRFIEKSKTEKRGIEDAPSKRAIASGLSFVQDGRKVY